MINNLAEFFYILPGADLAKITLHQSDDFLVLLRGELLTTYVVDQLSTTFLNNIPLDWCMCWTCSQGYPGVGEALSSVRSLAPVLISSAGLYLALHIANYKISKKLNKSK